MRHYITNGILSIAADERGAELASVRSEKSGIEYLWQGDPEFWRGRAYNMFPFNGRLAGGKYSYNGKVYEMPLHGFVRNSNLEFKEGEGLTFVLKDSESTRSIYPFKFVYEVNYSLDGNILLITHKVTNRGENTMYYGLGMHPGFNVPFAPDTAFEDYALSFGGEARRAVMSDNVLNTEREVPLDMIGGKLRLRHDLFDNDAVMVNGTCGRTTLSAGKAALTLVYPDYPHIGFWHTASKKAPFVCFEPMTMYPGRDKLEDIATFTGITALKSGDMRTVTMKLIIDEDNI